MTADKLHLFFDRMSRPVALHDCRELSESFPLIFPGWRIREIPGSAAPPVLNMKRQDDRYVLDGYWLDKPVSRGDRVSAIGLLVAELVRAWVRDDDSLLCLHGAAAEFAGKLVVFPSTYRAGKSILAACMASVGIPLFCDDVLPISMQHGQGIAPGLAPRLRVPLPDELNPGYRSFIDAHNCLQGEQYLYLDLDDDLLLPKGRQSPVGAFVLLEREAGIGACLETVSEAEILRQVIWQNFAREVEAPAILSLLSGVVAESRRLRLRYDRIEDAIELLQEKFSTWPRAGFDVGATRIKPDERHDPVSSLLPGYYLRNPEITVVEIDGQSFLADSHGASIHHLNTMGSSIWSLLSEPITLEGIMEILLTAFPDLDGDEVRRDVSNLIGELARKNLLHGTPDN